MMKHLIREKIKSCKKTVEHMLFGSFSNWLYRNRIPLTWNPDKNWGDALNPVLVKLLSGKNVVQVRRASVNRYIAIGSILDNADNCTEVWGSGFIKEGLTVRNPPKCIHAVRGPLSRAALLNSGINCPEVYGDPALLLPFFFDPSVVKVYEIGIIPHCVDINNPWVEKQRVTPGVLIIDIKGDIWEFVRAVKSCKKILSSSLHGLICADAYGVPNAWIHLSDGLIGGNFKFRDYRLSIGAGEPEPVVIYKDTSLQEAESHASLNELQIDLKKLLFSCPFLSPKVAAEFGLKDEKKYYE